MSFDIKKGKQTQTSGQQKWITTTVQGIGKCKALTSFEGRGLFYKLEVPSEMSLFPHVASLWCQDLLRFNIQDWKRISELMRSGNLFFYFCTCLVSFNREVN